jgi:hypothetical protein
MPYDAGVADPRLEIRLPPDLAARIDRWRRDQPDLPNRAEAARRLIELGLAHVDLASAAPPPEREDRS